MASFTTRTVTNSTNRNFMASIDPYVEDINTVSKRANGIYVAERGAFLCYIQHTKEQGIFTYVKG